MDKRILAKAGFAKPMKAVLVGKLPVGAEWLYEVKLDGHRAEVIKKLKGEVDSCSDKVTFGSRLV